MMAMGRIRLALASMLLAVFGFVVCAHAQVSRGTITGRVSDPAGAVIPGATVVVTEGATGAKSTIVTNAVGEYTAPFLVPGTYNINISAQGFGTSERKGIQVGANEQVAQDFKLELGHQTESVTVEAGGSLLENVTASIGQELNTEDLQNLPVDGNTPMIVSQLAVGVLVTGNPQFFHPYDNSGPSGFSMGGAPASKNELLLDGAPDGQGDSTIAYNPPMDAAEEVKVEAFEPDAAYGHTAGGTVNQVLKHGGNKYHGTLYEYGQWSALDDTPWFTKAAGQVKSVSRYNQFGATFGGPVMVPHLYDGHDRIFYFVAYEGIYDNAPSPSIITVPTVAERNGDFSALLALGSSYTIYDPYTATQSGSTITRKPISSNGVANVIPAAELNSVGVKLANYYPAPNYPSTLANGENNYYTPGNSTDRFDSEIGRVDVNITSKNKMFYDFRHNDRFHTSGNLYNNIATGSVLISPNWGSTLDDVHVFTAANTVWDNRVNWTRNITSRPLVSGVPLASLGFPASLQPTVPAFPVTSISPFSPFGYSKGQYVPFDSWQIFSMVSHAMGRHSLEFGADLRLYKQGSFSYGNSAGSYTFGTNWTNGPTTTSAAAAVGQELAGLELGLPTAGSIDVNTNQTTSAEYYAIFVQDNYRILPRLTLNLGLRYEHDLPTVESDNRAVNGFAASTVSPINAQAQTAYAASPTAGFTLPALMGGLVFATSSNRNLYQTRGTDFAPRLGIAWTPVDKTTVHGGIGIFNDSVGRQNAISPGYNQTTQELVTSNNYLSPATTLSNPFPAGLTPPPGNSQGLATYLGQSVSFPSPKILNDYAIRYTFNIQQEFPGNVLFEVGYMGSHVLRLGVTQNLDSIPVQYLSVGQVRNQTAINNLSQSVSNPFANLLPGTTINGAKVALSQLVIPYPQYTGVSEGNQEGSSTFNLMEARLEKRMSHGIRFLVNYAWSKKLDRLDYLNPEDTVLEKRISADDRPQRLVLSGTWELPFGEKRRYNPSVPAVNYLISGWNVTPIYTFQPDGPPLAWGDLIFNGPSLNALQVNPHNPKGAAFNTALFDTKSADQPVTADHIRTLPTQVAHARADGINSVDLSIAKYNRITERLHAQLRGDFFNFANRPQFAAPATSSATSSGFGLITSQANLPRQVQVELKLIF